MKLVSLILALSILTGFGTLAWWQSIHIPNQRKEYRSSLLQDNPGLELQIAYLGYKVSAPPGDITIWLDYVGVEYITVKVARNCPPCDKLSTYDLMGPMHTWIGYNYGNYNLQKIGLHGVLYSTEQKEARSIEYAIALQK